MDDTGFEPVTSSMSRKRSTTELIIRSEAILAVGYFGWDPMRFAPVREPYFQKVLRVRLEKIRKCKCEVGTGFEPV